MWVLHSSLDSTSHCNAHLQNVTSQFNWAPHAFSDEYWLARRMQINTKKSKLWSNLDFILLTKDCYLDYLIWKSMPCLFSTFPKTLLDFISQYFCKKAHQVLTKYCKYLMFSDVFHPIWMSPLVYKIIQKKKSVSRCVESVEWKSKQFF